MTNDNTENHDTTEVSIELNLEQIRNIDDDDLSLSPRQKQLWELYKGRDMTYRETADAMDIEPNTVQNYLGRIFEKREKAKLTLEWMDWMESDVGSDGLDDFE